MDLEFKEHCLLSIIKSSLPLFLAASDIIILSLDWYRRGHPNVSPPVEVVVWTK